MEYFYQNISIKYNLFVKECVLTVSKGCHHSGILAVKEFQFLCMLYMFNNNCCARLTCHLSNKVQTGPYSICCSHIELECRKNLTLVNPLPTKIFCSLHFSTTVTNHCSLFPLTDFLKAMKRGHPPKIGPRHVLVPPRSCFGGNKKISLNMCPPPQIQTRGNALADLNV